VAHQHHWDEKEKLQMFFLSGHLKQEIQFWQCFRKEEMSGETLYSMHVHDFPAADAVYHVAYSSYYVIFIP